MKLLKDLIIIKIIIFMKSIQTNDDNNELTSSPFQWCSHYYPCQAPVSKTWGWSNQNESKSQSHTSLRWLSIQNSSISSHAQDVNDKQDVIFVIPIIGTLKANSALVVISVSETIPSEFLSNVWKDIFVRRYMLVSRNIAIYMFVKWSMFVRKYIFVRWCLFS